MNFLKLRSKILGVMYRNVLKPVLFCFDAEVVHTRMTHCGELLGSFSIGQRKIKMLFHVENPLLKQSILNIDFQNPIGLSAGFDYKAQLPNILPSVGFGFGTIGTITNKPYEGNPRPLLGRLPKSKSLLVNKGFKNDGIDSIIDKISNNHFLIPIGLSLGKTNGVNSMTQEEAIKDVVTAFKKATNAQLPISYFELNISCPNLIGSVSFYQPEELRKLLISISTIHIDKPIFLKMPITETDESVRLMLLVTSEFPIISGVIFGNLWKDRSSSAFDPREIANATKGNFSGKPTYERSNELITLAYKEFGKRFVVIGCGGVFNANDAYKKIRLGASLVQMITGMIFEGPQVIGEINLGLVDLLKRDGFKNISEVVGVDI